MEVKESDFRDLMREMSKGSGDAAWKIAEIYTPHIMRAIRSTLPSEIRSKFDSQDFAQLVWASILLKTGMMAKFERPEHFIAYLASVARNKVIDSYRKLSTKKNDVKREVPFEQKGFQASRIKRQLEAENAVPSSNDPSPSQIAILRETWENIVQTSSDRDRQIVALRMKGTSYTEIAESLSISEKTVRRSLTRLIEMLAL